MKSGKRNFGYGHQLGWACRQALIDRYGHGHYGTVSSHSERFRKFAKFCKSIDIRDAREITEDAVRAYCEFLADLVSEDEVSVAYAQNLLSTVNVCLTALRGDRILFVSPSKVVGVRSHIRVDVPLHIDYEDVLRRVYELVRKGELAIAAIVWLARSLGLRFRECSLLDAAAAIKQARKHGYIEVVNGTKGGRSRVVSAAEGWQLEALEFSAEAQQGRASLISSDMNFESWRNYAYARLRAAGIRHFHDLRASFGCDRYLMLTGVLAPVLMEEGTTVPRELDDKARLDISGQLGHSRLDVVAAYIGARRK